MNIDISISSSDGGIYTTHPTTKDLITDSTPNFDYSFNYSF